MSPRPRKRRWPRGEPAAAPTPLDRAPRTDLEVRADDLDARVFAAIEAVAERLGGALEASTSLAQMRRLLTQAHLLLAMKSTHRSIRHLVGLSDRDLDLSVDALPLTRIQLERCFLALLIADNPVRWHTRYRKNAFKAYAEKFFRDQRTVGHIEPFAAHFAPDGAGIRLIREFAHEMDVSEDELQTLRRQTLQDREVDPRWREWFIADMPTPGRTLAELSGEAHRRLAEIIYPYYDSLSHFSHGGLIGVMAAAILRPHRPAGEGRAPADRRPFWTTEVLATALPLSYVAMLLVATLFARDAGDEAVRPPLLGAWRPYVSDGSLLGIAVWDGWAAEALGAAPGPAHGDEPAPEAAG